MSFQENAEQRMAFDFYFRLGAARSLTKVAEQTGRHVNTLKNWSRDFRWQERVTEQEKAVAAHQKDVEAIHQEQDLRKKHVSVYDVAISKGVQEIANGNVKIKSMAELISLIEARWKLAKQAASSADAIPTMNFNGPTKLDLGLEKMSREEKIKFLQDMLQAIVRVQTRPPMGQRLSKQE